MYRDDVCAVCGESLPPDHFYCRVHAAEVDDRLHELGERLRQLVEEVGAVGRLLGELAPETVDWLADNDGPEAEWPPPATLALRAEAEVVDVAVDAEPGMVRLTATPPLAELLTALHAGLDTDDLQRFAAACREAEGANATH